MKAYLVMLLISLGILGSSVNAAIVGKLTPLNQLGIQNGIGREMADGIYDAVQVLNVHKLLFNKADGTPWLGPLLPEWHTGLYHGWNINQRGDHFGITTGPTLYASDLTPILDLPLNVLGLGSFWKPSQYITVTDSVQAFVGYRPVLNGDLVHNLTYGGMFVLQGKFTPADIAGIIQKGL